jgi:GlpG protein
MRLIGHLKDEPAARVFGDYLLVQGIENTVESDHGTGWAIWITDEDKIEKARGFLGEFEANPRDARYKSQARSAPEIRATKEKEQARWEKKVKGRREVFRPLLLAGMGPLTLSLIVISAIVYVLMRVQAGERTWLSWLFISSQGSASLPEVRGGQVWRLITPIFLHFGILHILFNMLWLRDLGGMIEGRQGTKSLALLVFGLAAGSNLAQFYIGQSPLFGGMSGVVYGLLGYVWIRGKFDPGCGMFVHPTTVMLMLVWFVAGFSGMIGGIANWAHAGGLVLGMGWGYLAAAQRG